MKTVTFSSHYPNALLKSARSAGMDIAALLKDAKISPQILIEPQTRVPATSYVKLFRRILRVTRDESFGFLPRPMALGAFGFACELAANCSTIGQALEKLCHYYKVVTDDIEMQLSVQGESARFTVALKHPELDVDRYISDSFMAIAHRLSSWLAGQTIQLSSAGFAFDVPAHVEEYAYLFPCQHEFNQTDGNFITFGASYLSLPVIRTEAEVSRYIKNAPADYVSQLNDNESMAGRVYRVLSRGEHSTIADCCTVAAALALTEQTLRRKLKAEATSFQQIKDNFRRDVAIFHLGRTKYTIAEIAERLGFSAPGAFSRAFKHWTGASPEAYRKQ